MNKIAIFMTGWSKEYLSYIYQGIRRYGEEHQIKIHMYLCFGKIGMGEIGNKKQYDFFQFPDLNQYDGVIIPMLTIMENSIRKLLLDKIRSAGIPCVSIEEEYQGMSWIGINQHQAMRDVIEHMIQKHNATRFCYLGGPAGTYEAGIRKDAFLMEMKENKFPIKNEWIIDACYQYEDGYQTGQKLIEEFNKGADLPDAIICANDEMAAGVYDILHENNLEKKIGVTGFDYYRTGEHYRPFLTTIARPRSEFGYESCKLIEQMISERHGWMGRRELEYHIVTGNTCGCCPSCAQEESKTIRQMLFREHQTSIMVEYLGLMDEKTTRDVSGREIAEGIIEIFQFFKGRYLNIVVADNFLENEEVDYKDCNETFAEWKAADYHADQGEVLVFVPLHFQARTLGYVCMSDIDEMISCGFIESFLRNISFALENYIQKQQYREINRHYHQLFMTDQLTGLYNRFGLNEYGLKLYEKNCLEKKDTYIIFGDINRLKYINDTFGHQAGDWAICAVGKALKFFQTDNCLPFRYGGDEYIVLVQTDNADKLIQGIRQKLEDLQKEEPQEYHVDISLGFMKASWEKHEKLETYFIKADKIMYQEKLKAHKQENCH
ncbi:MAG: GGDEF domain-containing protein [Muribaculaceae bacterium]|nr:GGDEF domain-containing protein [Muribaculaceae bacterium]